MAAERPTDRDETALLADLDQLTAGLARSEQAAVMKARQTLALLARDASPNLLLWIYRGLAQYTEAPADGE